MNQSAPAQPLSPCHCGSGISYQHCCGLRQLCRLEQSEMARFEASYTLANQSWQLGDGQAAASHCVRILEQAPAHIPALTLLYRIKKDTDQQDAARVLLQRLVALDSNNAELTAALALLLYERGDLAAAEQHGRNSIRLSPRNPQAHNIMGMVFTDTNRALAGEFHYRRALELHPPVGKLYANLGLNLKNQGKLEQAEYYYREALKLEPDNVLTLLGWVRLEESRQDFIRAQALLDQAEVLQPDSRAVAMARATLFMRTKDYDRALESLDRLEQSGAEDRALGAGYFTERGRLLDKMGRYDAAFAAYDSANRLIRESGRGQYNAELAQHQVASLKGFFVRSRLGILPRAKTREDVAQPIFIIGFPRSGTTMTEQILTSHPRICAGDELTFINDLTRFAANLLNSPLSYPNCLADLWMGDNHEALDSFRDYYLRRAQQQGFLTPDCCWFTDKMPLNEAHLGLIHLTFPESPVIHLHRHPLDVVLSTYFTDLTHGFNCSYSLESAARHYVLIMDLVAHYLQEMDIKYQAVRYEDIVMDQQAQTRMLLDFIGETWDERCLDFHENSRFARTASYAQVTEKLYTSSKYRYRNYRKHIESIVPILEPVMERLGYALD